MNLLFTQKAVIRLFFDV